MRGRPREGAGFLATNPPYGVRLEDRDDRARADEAARRTCCARISAGGTPPSSPARPMRGSSSASAPSACTPSGTARSNAACCGCTSPPRPRSSCCTPAAARASTRALAESPGAKMFGNRLAKNIKQLEKWAAREQVSCYRLYDADMPEYSFAIDRYAEAGGNDVWLYVQEYAAPKTIEPEAVQRRRSRGAGGAAGRHRHRRGIHPPAPAPPDCARRPVREVRRERGLPAGRGSGPAVLGELHRLSRHRAVPRSPHHARAAARRGSGQTRSSTCSPTRAAPRCTPRRAARAKPRPSTCRPPTSNGLSRIWR